MASWGEDHQMKVKGSLNGRLTASDFNLPEPPLTKITFWFHGFQHNANRLSCEFAIGE